MLLGWWGGGVGSCLLKLHAEGVTRGRSWSTWSADCSRLLLARATDPGKRVTRRLTHVVRFRQLLLCLAPQSSRYLASATPLPDCRKGLPPARCVLAQRVAVSARHFAMALPLSHAASCEEIAAFACQRIEKFWRAR